MQTKQILKLEDLENYHIYDFLKDYCNQKG